MKIIFWISLASILYVYFGYPFLLAAFSRFARKKQYLQAELPTVSLIIAAYNEEDVIERKLENSLALNYPAENLEVIVAADGSSDNTQKIVKSFKDRGVVISYQPKRQGKMAAICHAVELARNEILVFSDANNMYEEITFKYLLLPFNDKGIGGTTGSKNVCDDSDQLSASEGLYWKYESWIKKNESRLNTCTAAAGESFAMRKSLFDTPPEGIINDDFYLMLTILKRGYKVVYVPEAKSWERVSASEKDEIRRRKRINAGRYQALFHARAWLPWKNPIAIWQILSHKFLRLFVPLFMIFAFISNAWLAVIEKRDFDFSQLANPKYGFRFFFICQLIFYLLAALFPLLSEKKGLKALYIPAFLVNSNYAALQGLFGFVIGSQNVLWERVERRKSK
jgi:cellulose synthase/poly-beta-1,6-N-acetylglucosamine synthase-like glycosyltransferase